MSKPRSRKYRTASGITACLAGKSRERRHLQQTLRSLAEYKPDPRNDLCPELVIIKLPIERLQQARRPVRKADEAQIARITASIREFGICRPILIDREYRVVDGHLVVQAARRLGLDELPAIMLEHLEPERLRKLSIALNRLGELGRWDEDALRLEFAELLDLGENLLVTGFEMAEIDALLLGDEEMDDADRLPDLQTDTVSRSGDIWRLGRHLLLQGDALDPRNYELLFHDDERARLVLTDEPYNVPNFGHVTSNPKHRDFATAFGELSREEFSLFNRQWMESSAAYLIEGGLLATFIDFRSFDIVVATGLELGLHLINTAVWVKDNAGQGSLWRSQHELLPVFKKGSASHVNNVHLGRFGRWRSNVWQYPGASSLGSDARAGLATHPTVKPVALLEDALLDVTNRDDIVLDPFCGSGSTLIAAERVGRICRAIEIDSAYCDLIIRRWQDSTGENATLAETGERFATVDERRRSEHE